MGLSVQEIALRSCCARAVVYRCLSSVTPSARAGRRPPKRKLEQRALIKRRVSDLASRTTKIRASKKVFNRGRPKKDGTPRGFKTVFRIVQKPVYGSPAAIARQMRLEGRNASTSTVRRLLLESGFVALIRQRQCLLTDEDMSRRVAFCNRILQKPSSWFKKVMFSDEKWFDSNDSGSRYCWVKTGSKPLPREQSQSPAKVFAWGVVGGGVRRLVLLEFGEETKGLQGPQYIRDCLSTLEGLKGRVLVQDGATCHWTPAVKTYLQHTLNVDLLEDWPAHSADLNPIETVWSMLSKRVSDRGPWGREELCKYVREEFDKLDEKVVDGLAAGWQSRLKKCVERGGKWIE